MADVFVSEESKTRESLSKIQHQHHSLIRSSETLRFHGIKQAEYSANASITATNHRRLGKSLGKVADTEG